MTETTIELTEDEFGNRYPLVPNHFNPSAGWAIGDAGGCLFETYGDEFAFVMRRNPRKIWTLVDGDDGNLYLISGLHFVNRVGYLLSTVPIPDHVTIQVRLLMAAQEDDLERETS